MSFALNISKFLFIVLLICASTNVTTALRCSNCLEPNSCRISPIATVQCSEGNVALHHQLLSYPNPSLAASTGTGETTEYKCFDVKLTYTSALTGISVLVEEKGCTHAGTNLCEGWNTEITHVMRCSTCDSGDECNK